MSIAREQLPEVMPLMRTLGIQIGETGADEHRERHHQRRDT